jgi:hypothetical protein
VGQRLLEEFAALEAVAEALLQGCGAGQAARAAPASCSRR